MVRRRSAEATKSTVWGAAQQDAELSIRGCYQPEIAQAENRESMANRSQPALSREEEQLERDFTDPLSTLPQLTVKDSYTPANYGPCTPPAPCVRDEKTNQVIMRPLIPRVPPNTLLPFMGTLPKATRD
jgi:hypothetical protein